MPVKVLHLITELNVGGAEMVLARLLGRLGRDRFDPRVACWYGARGMVGRSIRGLGIPVIDLNMTAKWRWDAFCRLYRLLRRFRPHILHCWMFHANLPGRIIGRMAGVPIIITSRRISTEGPFRDGLNRLTAGLDDRVIAVCEAARRAEIRATRVPPEKVVTIHNGLDPARFHPCPSPQERARVRHRLGVLPNGPLIGSVGRLHAQKGYSDLLTALGIVCRQMAEIRLIIVGEGKLRSALHAQAVRAGLSGRVVFAGARCDVSEILPALDLFVLPSLYEGLPNVVLEAMAAGLPVVATGVDGTREVVLNGKTGLLVPPGDPAALAEAIGLLMEHPDLGRKMGAAGRERIRRHFSIAQMAGQTAWVYEALLKIRPD